MQSWAQREKEKPSWSTDFIVCFPGGGFGGLKTLHGLPVLNMLFVADHYLGKRKLAGLP